MEFGVHLPQLGWRATPEAITEIARQSEAMGYESLWVSDHIAIPEKIETEYPLGGKFPVPPELPWLDPLGTLCFVAAQTETARLGTSVLVLPWRMPVQTTKVLITLDQLSKGRLILGAGAGWMPEEFAALGMPFDHRGARLDEHLDILEALSTEEMPEYHGTYYEFEKIGFNPKPVNGRITLWMGGASEAGYKRAARRGDGFQGAYASPAALRAQWASVRRYAEEAGRDPDTIVLSNRMWLAYGAESGPRADGSLFGSTGQIVEQAGELQEMGVTHIVVDVIAPGGIEGRLQALQRLKEEVRPQLG